MKARPNEHQPRETSAFPSIRLFASCSATKAEFCLLFYSNKSLTRRFSQCLDSRTIIRKALARCVNKSFSLAWCSYSKSSQDIANEDFFLSNERRQIQSSKSRYSHRNINNSCGLCVWSSAYIYFVFIHLNTVCWLKDGTSVQQTKKTPPRRAAWLSFFYWEILWNIQKENGFIIRSCE